MRFEGRPPATKERPPKFQIVPSRGRVLRDVEVRNDGEWLCLSLHTPDIHESKFRYSISKRYLLVWADGSSHAQHQFVILPRPVDPHDHEVSYTNGVVDARIRIRPR